MQTLTLQPTVQDGVIIYEDSPLVRLLAHLEFVTQISMLVLLQTGKKNLSDYTQL